MPVPASSRISRKDYERLLAHAAKEPDFVYLGSPGPGNGRGSLNGFTACAIATKCMTYTPDETLNTGRLAEEMEDVVRRYAISEQESNGYLCGGWVGFLSYEFGHSKEKHLLTTTSVPATPLLHAGFYLWATSHNRATDTFFLWVHPQCPQHILSRLESWLTSPPADAGGHWEITAPFKARQPVDEFKAGVGAVLRYIDAGDCYQANLSQEFQSRYTGNPWHGFQALTKANPTPYSAFIKAGAHTLLSASPERFLEVCEGTVKTSPIKGTRRRGATPEQDKALAEELLASEKDRAENLMIVDLLRNDLSVNAHTGSVKVDELFALESYENVHHLVSHIRAELAEGVSPLQALFDAFPGGSITGAPKIRAMEIIHELEPHWRGPYCGSVFYYGLDGRLDSNIAIRTLLCERDNTDASGVEHGTIRCWGGGGIVADSEPEAEYQETLTKVKPLMDFLENLKL